MRRVHSLLALLVLASIASAADLSKIERRIEKEPVYLTKTQRYALVVIGPDAADRLWLVHDGNDLHVLADKPVKLTSKNRDSSFEYELPEVPLKRFLTQEYAKDPGMLAALKKDPDAVTMIVRLDIVAPHLNPKDRVTFMAAVVDHHGPLVLPTKAADAPIFHFGGPLQVTLSGTPQFKRERTADVVSVVGTPGLGAGTFAMLAYDGTIPESVHPKLEVTFPPVKPGAAPIKQLYELTKRC
jgi:hypothetical protein